MSLLLLVLSTILAQPPAIPDTPAGRTFKAWLDAYNSGDRDVAAAYAKRYQPDRTANMVLGFRDVTGGFDFTQVLTSDRVHLTVLLKDRIQSTPYLVLLDVTDADPAVATRLRMIPLPRGTTTADINTRIDQARRARVIDSVVADIERFYLVPALAKQMGDALRAHQKHGDYDTLTDGFAFVRVLSTTLQDLSHDKHLTMMFSPAPMPMDILQEKPTQRTNCAFEKAEILPGNIGYISFRAFLPAETCAPMASAAMNFVAHTDAIIFDLRRNNGGEPSMVAFILSYLFDQPTHLSDIWVRTDSSTRQYWTLPYVPGERSTGKPVYVLTSTQTFSGGEAFAYDLQNLKRAVIVGETTRGGAHPADAHLIDRQFLISVPFATAINPISHTSWEGVGVVPDVKVPADSALAVAERLAVDTLRVSR